MSASPRPPGVTTKTTMDHGLAKHKDHEQLAEALIPLIGHLYRERNIVTTLWGERLVNASVTDLLRMHNAAAGMGFGGSLSSTLAILQAVASMSFCVRALRLDAGKSAELCRTAFDLPPAVQPSMISMRLKELGIEQLSPSAPQVEEARSVVLYGFGRIGRLLARLLTEKTGDGHKLLLRAIVVRKSAIEDLHKRASLLAKDSIHGKAQFMVEVLESENALVLNGNVVRLIYSSSPDKVNYASFGWNDVIVIDNTGKWRDAEGLGMHLKSPGCSNVILTAPGKGEVPNVVAGVNDKDIDFNSTAILSAASCTTNAITPVLHVLQNKYGISNGHIETVHSFTNDQNLTDNFHYKARRGRSAPLNLVLTETGAGKAVEKCVPSLAGKLTANAIRVPTPNVSMAILVLNTTQAVGNKEQLNTFLRGCSAAGPLRNQIGYSADAEAVSSDFVGDRHAGIIDANATICNGTRANIYVWYDNEFGYSCQVVRLLQRVAGIEHPAFPRDDDVIRLRDDSAEGVD